MIFQASIINTLKYIKLHDTFILLKHEFNSYTSYTYRTWVGTVYAL